MATFTSGNGGDAGGGGANGSWDTPSNTPVQTTTDSSNNAETAKLLRQLALSQTNNSSGRTVPSSEPTAVTGAVASFPGDSDTRVKILVPDYYFQPSVSGSSFLYMPINGILFPYTPTFNQEYKASYKSFNAVHSNYTQYFYQNSSVGEISITGKFTVQNAEDARFYLQTIHLLRALTKMKFGDDENAGAPPPVCRLFAYGQYMFNNTPVVIMSSRIEMNNDTDYFTVTDNDFGTNAVPVISSITVNVQPLYSRQEMMAGTVKGWLTPNSQRKTGYL